MKWQIIKGDRIDVEKKLNQLDKNFHIEIQGVTHSKYDVVIVISLTERDDTETLFS